MSSCPRERACSGLHKGDHVARVEHAVHTQLAGAVQHRHASSISLRAIRTEQSWRVCFEVSLEQETDPSGQGHSLTLRFWSLAGQPHSSGGSWIASRMCPATATAAACVHNSAWALWSCSCTMVASAALSSVA